MVSIVQQDVFSIHKIGDDGDFGATVIAGITGLRDRAR
jgi:hypothetical protein